MWCYRAGVKLLSQLRTSKKLGWSNCAAVAVHRLALSAGIYQRQLPVGRCPVPEALSGCRKHVPFISEPWFVASRESCLAGADALLAGRATWFSNEEHEIGSPPDWFFDPASGQRFPDGSEHWSRCKPCRYRCQALLGALALGLGNHRREPGASLATAATSMG